jgi:phenylpyruvate tautomerase PptA (4-oxalocrotonate tautomerase family)
MPYLHVKIGKPLTEAEQRALYEACAELICLIPGKNADNCLVHIEQDCALYMKGERVRGAFVDLRLYKPSPLAQKRAFTKGLCDYLTGQLALCPEAIYMNILEMEQWVAGGEIK